LFVVEIAKVGNLVEKILHACVRYKPCHCNLSNLSWKNSNSAKRKNTF